MPSDEASRNHGELSRLYENLEAENRELWKSLRAMEKRVDGYSKRSDRLAREIREFGVTAGLANRTATDAKSQIDTWITAEQNRRALWGVARKCAQWVIGTLCLGILLYTKQLLAALDLLKGMIGGQK